MLKKEPLVTDLVGGKTKKTDERIAFFGAADELSAHIMRLTHYVDNGELKNELCGEVRTLSAIMGEVAGGGRFIGDKEVGELCGKIAKYEKTAGAFSGFVLPGQTAAGAEAHIVRTVARRAELAYAKVFETNGGSGYIFEYLNKLSSLFFAIARVLDKTE